ncbi:kinetochore protein Spc25 isoform X2 [Heterodontus francisci]|uniref:kinetochore protein Spc25 isoform X2 n=1 Tax=Heterodontus francisci TaxID=7792 RepID=UPI00355AF453
MLPPQLSETWFLPLLAPPLKFENRERARGGASPRERESMDFFKEDEQIQLNEKLNETRIKFSSLWENYNPGGFKQRYKESLKITEGRCLEIYEEEKQMCEKVQLIKKVIAEQNAFIEKTHLDLQSVNKNIENIERQKQEVLEKIKKLKEGLFKKQEWEQLQFIFKCISQKNPEQPFTFLLKFNEEGNYEVTSCEPPLECMPLLQEKLKETNNFSAFLANVRKAFTALV